MPSKYEGSQVIRLLRDLLVALVAVLVTMCTPQEKPFEDIENVLKYGGYNVTCPTIVKVWRTGETGYCAWTDISEGYTIHDMYELGFLSEKKTPYEDGSLGYVIYEVPRSLLAWYLDQGPKYTQEFGGVGQLGRTDFSYLVNLNWPKVPPEIDLKPLATRPLPGFKHIRTFQATSELALLAFAEVSEDGKTGARTIDEITLFLGPYEGFPDHK